MPEWEIFRIQIWFYQPDLSSSSLWTPSLLNPSEELTFALEKFLPRWSGYSPMAKVESNPLQSTKIIQP